MRVASSWVTHVARALGEVAGSSVSDPGGAASVKRRLAEVIFTTALRDAFATDGICAPRDRAVATAVLLVQSDPAHRWTTQALARRVGLSRSSFSSRFSEAMGCGPGRYVQQVRLEHAAYRLTHGTSSVEEIARDVGYASASAFSVAFRRWRGESPARFAKARPPR